MSVIAYNGIFKKQSLIFVDNRPILVFIDKFDRLGITYADTPNYKITYIDTNVSDIRAEYVSNIEILYLKYGDLYITSTQLDIPTNSFCECTITKYQYGLPETSEFKLIRNNNNLEVTISSYEHEISRINRHENSLYTEPAYFADIPDMILETISVSPRYFGIIVTKDIDIKTVDLFRGLY